MKNKILFLVTVITFIPFLIITMFFIVNEYSLESRTGYGLLNLELAYGPDTVNKIFAVWGDDEIKKQVVMHYLDNFYILFYVLFGVELTLIVLHKLEGRLKRFGPVMILSFGAAGIFDALENLNLLSMLKSGGASSSFIPFIASLFATIKISFLVIGLGLLFIAVISLLRFFSRTK